VPEQPADGIVPALDVDSSDALERLVEATSDVPGVVAYKLGMSGALRLGLPGAIQAIRRHSDLPVVYDHQKAGPDVPSMAGKYAVMCREAGVSSVILFPLAGEGAGTEFVGAAQREGIEPIVGGDLPFPEYHVSGGGFVADDALERILRQSLSLGVTEFVLPANDADTLARHVATVRAELDRPTLYLPGIGALGGTISEAFAAAEGCRRYAVVGRAIADATDPREAALRLADEARAAAAAAS
jgi:orotidine-5'-phosphate decarboxylase